MRLIDVAELPANSAALLVAQSGPARPDFVLADRPSGRFATARWHWRQARLEGPMRLEQHLLSYCARGGALSTIVVEGVPLRARQHTGSVTFLPAGRYDRWAFEAPAEVTQLHVYIDDEAMREGIVAAEQPIVLAPLIDCREPWFDAFFRLLSLELDAGQAAGRLESVDLLERMGPLLLRRLLELQRHDDRAAPYRVAPLRPYLLRRVVDHVESHVAERITLKALAAIASLSVDHFVRAFEQAMGSTPHRWILERRLELARERLLRGTQPIEGIAHDCGFASVSHFSATFRRHLGVTPSAFRRGQ